MDLKSNQDKLDLLKCAFRLILANTFYPNNANKNVLSSRNLKTFAYFKN